jgi:hypothetical protein
MTANSAANEAQLASFLESKSLPLPDVAAFLANFEVESGWDPNAANPTEGAIGIAQWENGRRSALDAYAAATGGSETSLATQEGYLWSELTGPYAGVLAQVRQTSDPATAAAIVDASFEGSSGSTRQARVDDARTIYTQLSSGQLTGADALTAGTAAAAAPFPGGGWDPLNWPSDRSGAVGSAAGGILKVVLPFAAKGAFLVGGLALVVVGLYRASQTNSKQPELVEDLAGAAAAA